MSKTIEETLEGAMVFLSSTFSIGVNHFDNSPFSKRCYEHVEDKEWGKTNKYFKKIVLVSKVREGFEKLILFLEDNDVSKRYLIEEDQE